MYGTCVTNIMKIVVMRSIVFVLRRRIGEIIPARCECLCVQCRTASQSENISQCITEDAAML